MAWYNYYQLEGGNEPWKAVPSANIEKLKHKPMFITILAVDNPIPDSVTKEQLLAVKYDGPFYADFDSTDIDSCTIDVLEFIDKVEGVGLAIDGLEIYASGGKGYHILIDPSYFMAKVPKQGTAMLPQIYRELAFNLAVPSMDLGVYSGRKGRMLRMPNVQRPNGLYKVQISYDELKGMTTNSYEKICSKPRPDIAVAAPEISYEFMAMYDECRSKVQKAITKKKQQKDLKLPDNLPSFEALLRGDGIRVDTGFHQLALQIGITAHACNMSLDKLLEAANGLCEKHESNSGRYNTKTKRKEELARMYSYLEDNPCYSYSPSAICSLLTHPAVDLRGIAVSEEEVIQDVKDVAEGISKATEFDFGSIIMTKGGAFSLSEAGPKQVSALSFDNVMELASVGSGQTSAVEADIYVAGVRKGRQAIELSSLDSASSLNAVAMRHGQVFLGSDQQAKSVYLKVMEKARKSKNKMYVLNREGIDYIALPFHEDLEVRNKFLVWADVSGVVACPHIASKGLNFKFMGDPDPTGAFKTDLSNAPDLIPWMEESSLVKIREEGVTKEELIDNRELLRRFLTNLFECQKPDIVGRLIGWVVACQYRMLFAAKYDKFPILHIAGSAGQGKTEMSKLFCGFHYYQSEPVMLTPISTVFAVSQHCSGSASIPLILDEFKYEAMAPGAYDRLKLLMRDAYNNRQVERGGGNRDSADYRALTRTQMSAPICFVSESMETETALLERVVFITMIKPPENQMTAYRKAFEAAKAHKHILGILGKYMAACLVKKTGGEEVASEFFDMWEDAKNNLLTKRVEEKVIDEEDRKKRGKAKDRTVFNYTVVRFGLSRFKKLVQEIFGSEFDYHFDLMDGKVYNSMLQLQDNTIPEWLKVFNCFADMAGATNEAPYKLTKGSDYAFVNYSGKECLEIYARGCYFKYRYFMSNFQIKPLFQNDMAFIHGIEAIPAMMGSGTEIEVTCPGGAHMFDLRELEAQGFRVF